MPVNKCVNVRFNSSVLDAAIENDIILEHDCGGVCACTSCKIRILKGEELLNNKSDDENYMLDGENVNAKDVRLACQCVVNDDSDKEIIIEII